MQSSRRVAHNGVWEKMNAEVIWVNSIAMCTWMFESHWHELGEFANMQTGCWPLVGIIARVLMIKNLHNLSKVTSYIHQWVCGVLKRDNTEL